MQEPPQADPKRAQTPDDQANSAEDAKTPGHAAEVGLAEEFALTAEGLALLGVAGKESAAPLPPQGEAAGRSNVPAPPATPAAAAPMDAEQAPARQAANATQAPTPGPEPTRQVPPKVAAPHRWRRMLRSRLAAGFVAVSLGLGAWSLTRRPAPGPLPATPPAAGDRHPGLEGPPRGGPTPAVRSSAGVHGWSWPKPVLAPLVGKKVQQLDCASLRTGLRQEGAPPGLLAWAQFRLAWACSDAAARAMPLPAAPANARHEGADAMLAAAARAGLLALQRGDSAAPGPRPGAWERTPQGRLVAALGWEHAPAKRREQVRDRLQQARSLGDDGAYLLALLERDEDAEASTRRLAALVAQGDGVALARASRTLFETSAWAPLLASLERRGKSLAAAQLPALLVQASAVHRRWLMDLALRLHLVTGNLADALEVAQMHASWAPHDARVQHDAAALATLLQVGEQAPTAAIAEVDAGAAAELADAAQTPAWPPSRPEATVGLQKALNVAKKNGDAAAEAQLTAALLWHDPLAQDPVPLALAWLVDHLRNEDEAKARALWSGRLQHWVQARPRDDRPLQALIEVGEARNDVALRIDAYQSLLLRHPRDEALTLRMAQALVDGGQGGRAAALLSSLEATLAPAARPDLLYIKAQVAAPHDPLQARLLLAEANKLAPNARNDVALAGLFEAHGQLDEAAAALGRASAGRPQDTNLALRHADLLLRQGDGQAARRAMQAVAARLPNDPSVGEKLAEVQHKLGDLHGASQSLAAAAVLPGAPARLDLQLGRMQMLEMGQLNEGIASLRRALGKDLNAAEGHYLLGLGLRDVGDETGMRRAWHRYLELAPQGPYAAEVRQGLRR